MTTFTFGATLDELANLGNFTDMDANISSSTGQFVYDTADGFRVTVIGSGFTFDPGGNPTGGTISEVIVREGGVEVLRIFDATIVAADYQVGDFMNDLMQGDTVVTSTGIDPFSGTTIKPDGANMSSGIRFGGDNSVTGTTFFEVALGICRTSGTSIFVGGDSTLAAQFTYASGDVFDVALDSAVIGGDDHIVFSAIGEPIHGLISAEGDVYTMAGQSRVVGGNDIVDMREANTTSLLTVSGDANSAAGLSTLIGGDDIIYGASTRGSRLYGDAEYVATETTVVGGDDTIYAALATILSRVVQMRTRSTLIKTTPVTSSRTSKTMWIPLKLMATARAMMPLITRPKLAAM